MVYICNYTHIQLLGLITPMKKTLFIIILFAIASSLFAQEEIDSEYPIPFVRVIDDGEMDTSKLEMIKIQLTQSDSFNLIGTVLQEYVDSNGVAELDSSDARIRLINKKDTLIYYIDETFALKIPQGKYKIRITRVGVGAIDRKLKIETTQGYELNITLLSRRMIMNKYYQCKTKKDRRILKRILNSSDENFEEKCNCVSTRTTIYG